MVWSHSSVVAPNLVQLSSAIADAISAVQEFRAFLNRIVIVDIFNVCGFDIKICGWLKAVWSVASCRPRSVNF